MANTMTIADSMLDIPNPLRFAKWMARKLMSDMVGGKRVWRLGMPSGFSSNAVRI